MSTDGKMLFKHDNTIHGRLVTIPVVFVLPGPLCDCVNRPELVLQWVAHAIEELLYGIAFPTELSLGSLGLGLCA